MIDYRIKQHPPTMGQYIARKLANLFVRSAQLFVFYVAVSYFLERIHA